MPIQTSSSSLSSFHNTSTPTTKTEYEQTRIYLKGPNKFLLYPIDIDEKTNVLSILNEMKSILKDDKKYEIVWPERDASNRIKKVHSLFDDEKIFKYSRKKRDGMDSTKLKDLMSRCDLWMVPADPFYQTRIFFNPYIKLVLGLPCGYLDLYPNMLTDTVADLERLIKIALQIKEDDDRFSLFGFNNPTKEALKVKMLSKGDRISSLQEEFESSVVEKFHFWQFMVRPEVEGSLNLGVERETTLRIQSVEDYRKHRPYKTMAKVRVAQQGTTLSIWNYKDVTGDDNGNGKNLMLKLENIHLCQLKTVIDDDDQIYGIEIKSWNSINYLFSKQKSRIVRWMIHLRKATPSSEILEPVWMGLDEEIVDLKKDVKLDSINEEGNESINKSVDNMSSKEPSKSIFGKMFKNSTKTQSLQSADKKGNRLLNSLWNKISRNGPEEKERLESRKMDVEEALGEYEIAAGLPSSPSPLFLEVQETPKSPLADQKPISPRPLTSRPPPPVQRNDFLSSLPSSTILLGSTDPKMERKKKNSKKVTFQINEWDDWKDQIASLQQIEESKEKGEEENKQEQQGIIAQINPVLLNALKSSPSLRSLINEIEK